MDRYSSSRIVYGGELFSAIQAAKVLVVGAGGIGCELLKNLVLVGFLHINILDLDTIDVSNLNRQFLFRRRHVGSSKANIARDAALQFNPQAQIVAYHDNIKSSNFDGKFFEGFDLILNALDNIEARRHVNRLCLSARRTLIESGTQGYFGQVQVICSPLSACYECAPIQTPKTYAVCTIRNTPDKPVHCIVFAKHIFSVLFGPPDEGNILADLKFSTGTGQANNSSEDIQTKIDKILHFYFDEEIEKQRQVADRWKNRAPPRQIHVNHYLQSHNLASSSAATHQATVSSSSSASSSSATSSSHQSATTVADEIHLLRASLTRLYAEHSAELGTLEFDKDNDVIMDFVSAFANLRMHNFHIPMQSRFDNKGVAGNIIHAIATTNAIAAGLIVTQAVQVLRCKLAAETEETKSSGLASDPRFAKKFHEVTKAIWIKRAADSVLSSQQNDAANPNCYVCSTNAPTFQLRANLDTFQLKTFYDAVLKKRLAFNDPSIDVYSAKLGETYVGLLEDHDEDEDEDGGDGNGDEDEDSMNVSKKVPYLSRVLSAGGVNIVDGATVNVEDMGQKLSVKIHVQHDDTLDEEEVPEMFLLQQISGGSISSSSAHTDHANGHENNGKAEKFGVEDPMDEEEKGAGKNKRKRDNETQEKGEEDHIDKASKTAQIQKDDEDVVEMQ